MESLLSEIPIHRVAILHLNLALLSTGKELGEAASDEECGQQILYYHHDPSLPISGMRDNSQEAIQFAGLCSALYHLPTTLHSFSAEADGGSDPVQEVHLDESTLVFVPLKETPKGDSNNKAIIICVAQISRLRATALAIRQSIQRSHRIFSLLRSGGIHARLVKDGGQTASNDARPGSANNQHQCPYPGMDQLYQGLKTMRQLKEMIVRSSDVESGLEEEQNDLRDKLRTFKESLPMTSLREDLKFHYDAFIADMALCSIKSRGAGRCIVECIPSPIATKQRKLWAPGLPPPDVPFHLGQTITDLLSGWPHLLAVSTFFQKQLVYHHDQDGTFMEDNSSATLLFGYFAFYSFKMKQLQESQEQLTISTPSRRISQSFVSLSDHVPNPTSFNDSKGADGSQAQQGCFLEPPPLAMLSASEQQTAMVRGPNDELVWAPMVYFKALRDDKHEDSSRSELAHAVFYEWNDYGFLLYADPQAVLSSGALDISAVLVSGQRSKESIDSLLGAISDALSECLTLHVYKYSSRRYAGPGNNHKETYDEILKAPGQDVIYIDRASTEMKLFPRSPSKLSEGKTASPKRFLNAFRPSSSTAPETDAAAEDDGAIAWASEGMDCRHWLASHLPSDAHTAFDDVMNDVHSWRQTMKEKQSFVQLPFCGTHDGTYEVLTTIKLGWMYALADQEHELYILLDSTVYVTLADAHNSIKQVRSVVTCMKCQ